MARIFWLFLPFLGLFIGFSPAQGANWFTEVSKKSQQFTTLTADFQQIKKINGADGSSFNMASSGSLKVDRSQKKHSHILWQMKSPGSLLAELSANQIKITQGERVLQLPNRNQYFKSLLSVVGLELEKLKATHQIKTIHKKMQLELVPKQESAPFSKIVLSFNVKYDLAGLSIFEKSDDRIDIKLSNHKYQ